ncbi:MAG: hypothetical protein RIR16_818 [Actinomycetota bacterium]|jgi:phosphomannomutase
MNELLSAARAWLSQDPDPETRAELEKLIEQHDAAELEDRFGSRLGFGTAGLRGELGAGPNRMNRVLVAQAAAGIAKYLLNQGDQHPTVVIGYDGRKNSAIFARDSAEIMAGFGLKVRLFDSAVPTPVLAFAGKKLGTSAAIMVTASHNPPRDNGYKVYLGGQWGGSQIISPTDKQIAAEIEKVSQDQTFAALPKADSFELIGEELRQMYISETANLVEHITDADRLTLVYTALHGVGWKTVRDLFQRVGISDLVTVDAQLHPDENFPTVAFPNPEEPGAMDLAFATARSRDADLIIANDPDADRLAIAVPDRSAASGWRRLTGDEVGLILGDFIARRAKMLGLAGTLANSIVSSSALTAVADANGLTHTETLTGFKWISKVPNLIFGYEEALGYCVDPRNTPDKDGISAALVFTAIAYELNSAGKTIDEHLQQLGEQYGFYATSQISVRVSDLSLIGKMITALRAQPPQQIDGENAKFTDLALGSDNLAATDGLRFDLETRRVIIRPSGTEPKLKCYLQAISDSKKHAQNSLNSLEAEMRLLLQQAGA